MPHSTLFVELGERRYPIYIGKDLLKNPEILAKHIVAKQALVVTNKTVEPLYLKFVTTALRDRQCDVVVLPDGEKYKTLTTWAKIFDVLLQKQHHRNTTLIALGGGVVCDTTGFAAACYQRGVNFLQIPTTLLAQVDASIGGKTGVNHVLGKNMIGAFHQPRCVIVDTTTLRTLPEREFRAGLAEIIKAALIRDGDFFVWLEKNLPALLNQADDALIYAIEKACAIKAKIVAEDEKEQTQTRALLNLGHTFAHALEQILGYQQWLHGEAVAVGILLASEVSQRLGWITDKDVSRIKKVLITTQLPIRLPREIQCDKILEAMAVDKKWMDKQPKLVLLRALGHAELISNVDVNLIKSVIENNIRND